MKKGIRSNLHVVIQFGTLGYIVFSGPKMATSFWVIPEIVGLLVGAWALWVMRKSVFSIYPDPEPGISLVKKGPYHLVRHPMYLSLFLVLIPLVVSFPEPIRIIILIVFSINQMVKMYFEEKLLFKSLPEYQHYSKRTNRLIPYLY